MFGCAAAIVTAVSTALIAAIVGWSVPWVALPFAGLVAFSAAGALLPRANWLVPTATRANGAIAAVALTFDDGPDPQITPRVLEALAAAGAKATFFCIGEKLDRFPEIAQAISAAGHEIGNHSYRHPRLMVFWRRQTVLEDLRRCNRSIASATGTSPRWFRPPVGFRSPNIGRAAAALRLQLVNWSLRTLDTFGADAEHLAQRVLAKVRAGDIVLAHDGSDTNHRQRSNTVAALPQILAGLQRRGLRCVTLTELLEGRTGDR
ncbi:MAG: polysaccharide deacetylase family protein [Deltaproteobacteria bacterium]|nr:polysaccharide deacetylase family protein [Deltaproteobacteria bacterium]